MVGQIPDLDFLQIVFFVRRIHAVPARFGGGHGLYPGHGRFIEIERCKFIGDFFYLRRFSGEIVTEGQAVVGDLEDDIDNFALSVLKMKNFFIADIMSITLFTVQKSIIVFQSFRLRIRISIAGKTKNLRLRGSVQGGCFA